MHCLLWVVILMRSVIVGVVHTHEGVRVHELEVGTGGERLTGGSLQDRGASQLACNHILLLLQLLIMN
jgi:hypothetical protein